MLLPGTSLSDIFISYSRVDKARVKPLAEELTRQGWSVWWDHTILPGKSWDRVIEKALDEARCVVVLWSRNSVESDWVRTEADEGKRRGILVPALLDSVAIPLGFRRIQAANLVDWAADFTHVEFAKLVGAVSEILGGIPSPPPPPPAPAPRTIDLKTRVAEAEARDVADQSRLLLPSDADYWVRIGPGDYPFGEEGKRVKLAAFEIGRYPVTVWEYGKYLEQAGAARRPSGWEAQVLHPGRPVVNVSWHDAVKYCAWAKCGLPSEEQWEAAARGTEGRIYPWGSAEPDDRRANFNKLVGAPTPVGIFPEGNTPEGMADMAGNVWEWTASDLDEEYKVVRGACFDFDASRLRAAYRLRL